MRQVTIGSLTRECYVKAVRGGKGRKKHARMFCRKPAGAKTTRKGKRRKSRRGKKK
jgi:hypothetical protein